MRLPAAAGIAVGALASLLLARPVVADTVAASPSPSPSAAPSTSPSPMPSPMTSASPSPSPSPSASASPSPSPAAQPAPDPNQALYDRLKTRLSADLASALTDQQRLSGALDAGRVREQALYDQVDAATARVADLQEKIAQLDDQITATQDRIDAERSQVASLAGSMYRRPTNWLIVLARAKSVQDALVESADLVVAGQRAHALQARLEADLAKLNAERGARQDDLDRENATVDALNLAVTQLNAQLSLQDDISNQLLDLTSRMEDAIAQLQDQSPSDAPALVALLEDQQKSLAQAQSQEAWSLAAAGSGSLQVRRLLPAGKAPAGLKLAWPMPGSPISQPFGPSTLVLEPPLGPYPHFHTGVDFADPAGTPVQAAGDGIVVAAATGSRRSTVTSTGLGSPSATAWSPGRSSASRARPASPPAPTSTSRSASTASSSIPSSTCFPSRPWFRGRSSLLAC